MKRVKTIIWQDLNSKPMLARDEDWVHGDNNVNVFQLCLPHTVSGKRIQLFLSKLGDNSSTLYEGLIDNAGFCELKIESSSVTYGTWSSYLRVVDEDKILVASSNITHKIEKNVLYDNIILPETTQDSINTILQSIMQKLEECEGVKTGLDNSISTSNQSNATLNLTIQKSNTSKNELDSSVADCLTADNNLKQTIQQSVIEVQNSVGAKENLSLEIERSNVSKTGLQEKITEVETKANQAVSSVGTRETQAVNLLSRKESEHISAMQTEATKKINEIKTTQGMKGDKGDKGETGAQGIQGIKGDTGSKGLQGIQGIQGLKGDKGDRGDQGLKGEQGGLDEQNLAMINELIYRLDRAELEIEQFKIDAGTFEFTISRDEESSSPEITREVLN